MGPGRASRVGSVLVIAAFAGCGSVAVGDLFDGGVETTDADVVDGSSSGSGGGTHDAGPTDGATAADAPGAEAAGPRRTIHCTVDSGVECKAGTEVCCRNGSNAAFGCTQRNACTGAGSLPIDCDDPTDCVALGSKGVCCGSRDQDGSVFDVSCALANDCTGTLRVNLCDPASPNTCPNGGKCIFSTETLPGFYLCSR